MAPVITCPLPLQFLTNVFFIPYMAVRQFESKTKPNLAAPGCDPKRLPPYASVLAVVGAIVGVATFFWMPLAHPEFGSIADRFALSLMSNSASCCVPACVGVSSQAYVEVVLLARYICLSSSAD